MRVSRHVFAFFEKTGFFFDLLGIPKTKKRTCQGHVFYTAMSYRVLADQRKAGYKKLRQQSFTEFCLSLI